MDFTTQDNVMLFLNKTSLTYQESAQINMLIGMVTGIIQNYCGWNVLAKDYSETFDGDGSAILELMQYPLNTLTSLVIDGTDYTANVIMDSNAGRLYFNTNDGYTFTQNTANVLVSYNAGFTYIPSDLLFAATSLTVLNFNRIVQESIGIVSEQFNTIKVDYDKNDIPDMVKRTLDRYRFIGVF